MTKRIIALLLVVVCMVGIVGSAMAISSSVSTAGGGGKCKHLTWRFRGCHDKYYRTISPAGNDNSIVMARYVYEFYECTKCGATKSIFVDNQWWDAKSGRWRSNW